MQTIKKYANRKLYHTNRKQYITLEGIAGLIQEGEQIQVFDNETGADITAQILSQVVLQARGNGSRLPTHVLTGLIQSGGETIAGMRRSLWMTLGGSSIVEAEIARRLEHLVMAGTLGADEAGRIGALLLTAGEGVATEPSDVPSHSDVQRLHAQVDALASAVEQLLAERQNREPK